MTEKKMSDKNRLGRGLASLIPPGARAATSAPAERAPTASPPPQTAGNEGVQEVPLAAITPNSLQPRLDFDQAALDELAASIKTHGVLQPVLVRPRGAGRYELVAGERRFRAAQQAGLTRIPVVVRTLTDEESLTVALIENVQREDLNAIETARGYKQLLEQFRISQSELARQIGKSQPAVNNTLRLLNLPLEMQESIFDGRLTEAHGKALLSIVDPQKQFDVWQDAWVTKMTVKETQEAAYLANALTTRTSRRRPSRVNIAPNDVHWQDLQERLGRVFAMKAVVSANRKGEGTLTLKFSGPEQLEAVLERLQ